MTNTNTVTNKQIKQLRDEAIGHGDHRMADLCDRALATDTVDQDGNAISFADWTADDARAECARAECARVIAEAAEQSDDAS
jgi:hypothetical protein